MSHLQRAARVDVRQPVRHHDDHVTHPAAVAVLRREHALSDVTQGAARERVPVRVPHSVDGGYDVSAAVVGRQLELDHGARAELHQSEPEVARRHVHRGDDPRDERLHAGEVRVADAPRGVEHEDDVGGMTTACGWEWDEGEVVLEVVLGFLYRRRYSDWSSTEQINFLNNSHDFIIFSETITCCRYNSLVYGYLQHGRVSTNPLVTPNNHIEMHRRRRK